MTIDVIVIGLGAMGSATLDQLARRGVKALGIDRFDPPHSEGSSHGDTRITRCGIGEGAVYGPLAINSHRIWRELEALTGAELLLECGFLAIDGAPDGAQWHGKPGFLEATFANAQAAGVAHSEMTATEARHRWPQLALKGGEHIYFEPGGGLVFPERCIAAQLQQARALGAETRTGETVTGIMRGGIGDSGGVSVHTDKGTYRAARVVLAAGGWTPGLTTALPPMRLLRQLLHWFEPDDPAPFAPDRFPSFIWQHGNGSEDIFYGFPIVPGSAGVKVATEQYATAIATPEALDRIVQPDESAALFRCHVAGRLNGVTSTALKSAACFYTFAPDGDFIIDIDPGDDRVLVVSACSGHGFKHSAGIGHHVAEVVAGNAPLLPEFASTRFNPTAASSRDS